MVEYAIEQEVWLGEVVDCHFRRACRHPSRVRQGVLQAFRPTEGHFVFVSKMSRPFIYAAVALEPWRRSIRRARSLRT